jgi:arsenite methyltransferase
LLLIGWFVPWLVMGPARFRLRPMGMITGSVLFLEGILMTLYAKFGKFVHRDRMLSMISWRGDEAVLDVGTGRGLLMIGAAKKLATGRAVGIDIWSGKDLSGNAKENTLHNAEIEGVSGRVEVYDGDATALQFSESSFDVVLSNLCIHNIPSRKAREQACREILRVLKPGGIALISDFKNTGRYAKVFRSAGAQVERGGAAIWTTFPPLRIVRVQKPRP